jgi:ATP-binding cassette subfamily B protein
LKSLPRSRYEANQRRETFRLKHVFASIKTLPRIGRLVWQASPALTFWSAIFYLILGITPAISAIITQILFDGVLLGIREQSIAPIWLPVCLQLGLNVLSRICTVVGVVMRGLLRERVSDHVQEMVLRKANTLDMEQFENSEYYDTLRHATDEANYRPSTMITQTFDLLRTFVTLCSMLFLIAHLSWWLVLVALIVPIPSFISSSRYSWKDYILARRQSPERRIQNYYTQLLTIDQHIKEIRLFNLGNFFLTRFKANAEKLFEEFKRVTLPRAVYSLLWSLLSIGANSLIYLYIALQAVLRRITFGQLSKFVTAANSAGQSFQSILDGVTDTYENSLFVDLLFEFLAYEPKILPPEQPVLLELYPEKSGLDIEFRDVSFTYPGKQQPALQHVSFVLRAGETGALVGSNGAGKTTLVKLLARLYDPDEGEILLNGRNLKAYDPAELRKYLGVIFQDFVRYHMTARENIGIGRVSQIEEREQIIAAARKSGADGFIERLNKGYDAMLGRWFEKGVELSGGQWQKVALARAFMRDAPLLILDEPTSALDAEAEYEIFTRFRELTEGKTALFISHRFSTVRLADRIFVLEQGTIREHGSHDELIALNGRYAELFNLQARAYS